MVTFSLDDNQLRQICVLAEPLPPPLRSELLRMIRFSSGLFALAETCSRKRRSDIESLISPSVLSSRFPPIVYQGP